jgi:hypothetical protein
MDCATEVYNSIGKISTYGDGLECFFTSFKSVAIKDDDGVVQWIEPSKCVWGGPGFLTVVVPLEHLYGDQEYAPTLFQQLLRIRESNLADICDELDRRSVSSNDWTTMDAAEVYQYLEDAIETATQWKTIRYVAAFSRLVPLTTSLEEHFKADPS